MSSDTSTAWRCPRCHTITTEQNPREPCRACLSGGYVNYLQRVYVAPIVMTNRLSSTQFGRPMLAIDAPPSTNGDTQLTIDEAAS